MQEIGFVVFPGFQVMGLSAITAFEVTNLVLEKPAYTVTLLSETGGLEIGRASCRERVLMPV